MLEVKLIKDRKPEFVRPILESLPEWFGIQEAVENYVSSAETLDVLGCQDDQGPVGAVSLRRRFPQTYEIDVMAVVPRWHRKGIGRALVNASSKHVTSQGACMLTVKTLGPSRPDKNYDKTRSFYESVGFLPLEEFTNLWNDSNPCLFLVKRL